LRRTKKAIRLRKPLLVNGRKQQAGDWVMVESNAADRWIASGFADAGPDWESSEEKHVLMVSRHCCTRVAKQAAALHSLGWRVDSLSLHMPGILEGFDRLEIVRHEQEMTELIASSGAKIIHVHNEPDRLMLYADAAANGRPIVYDCHDLQYYRTFSVQPDELFAFERADAIIHVGKEHRDLAWKLHRWQAPETITMSCPMRKWTPPMPKTGARRGVVYQGGSHPNASNANRFRDHTVVADKFAKADIKFDLFVPTNAFGAYPGAHLMMPYHTMVKHLTTYKWGFVGTDIKTDKGDACMPNKVFEYLMAGLPIAACNVPAVEKFMDGKAGVYANDMDTLIAKMKEADWDKLHQEAIEHRRYMDDEIKHTLMVYDAVLGTHKCEFCGKDSFKSNLGLQGHMKSAHPDEYAAMRQT